MPNLPPPDLVLSRRQLLAVGGGVTAGLLAGCTDLTETPLPDWQRRLTTATDGAPKSIAFLGDSITFGAGAVPNGNSAPKFRWCYPGQLRAMLEPSYGNAGTGWILMNHDLWPITLDNQDWEPRITVTGRITKPMAGPFGRSCFTIPKTAGKKPSSYVEFTADGTIFSTLVLAKPAGRSQQMVSIDGGPPQVLTNSLAGGSTPDVSARRGPHPDQVLTDLIMGSDGPHTLRIWARGDAVDLVAVRARTGTGRFIIDTPAISGMSLQSFLRADQAAGDTRTNGLAYLDTFDFDLLIIALGTNDYNAGRSIDDVRLDLKSVVERQRSTGGDVALLFPPISSPTLYPGAPAPTYVDYEQLYATLATELDVPFLDLTHLWGSTFDEANAVLPPRYADGVIHPSDGGASDMATRCRTFLAL